MLQSISLPSSLLNPHSPPKPNPRTKTHLKHPSFSSQPHFSRIRNSNSDDPKPESAPSTSRTQVPVDPALAVKMVKLCSTARELKRVHAFLLKFSGSSAMFVNNNLISGYVRLGKVRDARLVFDGMSKRSVVSWTALLNGYSRMGLDDEFVELFRKMVERCVKGNSTTFVCVLNFCGRSLDFELGRQIHAKVVEEGWRNLIVDSALVYFYSQCGDIEDVFRVFDRMEAWDVVSWTSLITACARHGHGEEAFALLSRMQESGFMPNEYTVCSVLKACGEERTLMLGRQLHGAIVKKMIKADVFIGSSLVGMYVKCNEIADARLVFDMMPKRNTVTWTSMIAGYAQNGLGEEALRLFRKMKQRRILANNSTIASIVSACGLIGSLRLGKEVHGQVLKNCVHENLYIASTLIWLYCKCGLYAYAAKILEALPIRDVVSWTAMISGLTDEHDTKALIFLRKMVWEGVEPNPFTYSSALKACASIEAMRQGKWIHASVSKTRALANVYVGSALISLYMKCGLTDDALRVFEMMPEHNLVSWKVMIVGYAKNGLCKEALKLMYQMQEEGFEVDDYVHSTVLGTCGDMQCDMDHTSTVECS